MKHITLLAIVFAFTLVSKKSTAQQSDFLELNQKSIFESDLSIGYTKDFSNSALLQRLELSSPNSFKEISTISDELNNTHIKLQQLYYNIPVLGAQIVLHVYNSKVYCINGKVLYYNLPQPNVLIEKSKVLDIAKNHLGVKKTIEDTKLNKYFFKDKTNEPQLTWVVNPYNLTELILCWKCDVVSADLKKCYTVYTDVETGKMIKKVSLKHEDNLCSGPTRYNGARNFIGSYDSFSGVYFLETSSSLGPTQSQIISTNDAMFDPTFSSIDYVYSSSTNFSQDIVANSVHWAMQQTYICYDSVFKRNSFDGAGTEIANVIHLEPGFNNAFWAGTSFGPGVMVYGDGDGIDYNPFVSVDVTGHELSHGVTASSSQLMYESESGALNESFSDMMAIAVEQFTLKSSYNWLLGDGIIKTGTYNFLRDMSNPKNNNPSDRQPNTYKGAYWINTVGCVPDTSNDQCGVHTNSGVSNYWYYLVAIGGTGTNDNSFKYAVNGIGLDKASKIVYHAYTNYVTSSSNYIDAMNATKQSAKDLYGQNSTEASTVNAAWCAVGLGNLCYPLSDLEIQKQNIVVYPNPASEVISVKNIVEESKFEIFNTVGAKVKEGTVSANNSLIDIRLLQSGVYNIVITNKNQSYTNKIRVH